MMLVKALFVFTLQLISLNSLSQINAVTGKGDEVILYEDGTWKYSNKSSSEKKEIATNETRFTKSKESTFELKSNVVNAVIYLNPRVWSFKKEEEGTAIEYRFQLKDKDAYAMLLVERIEVPLEALSRIAFENAKKASPDIEIVKEEYRTVNDRRVLFMQMNGTIQGIKFSYFGYYYSSKNSTIQFISYTSQNLIDEYRKNLDELLNGFIPLD